MQIAHFPLLEKTRKMYGFLISEKYLENDHDSIF